MKKLRLAAAALIAAALLTGCGRFAGAPAERHTVDAESRMGEEKLPPDDIVEPGTGDTENDQDVKNTPGTDEPDDHGTGTEAPPERDAPEPADDELVPVRDYIPDIAVELKYATADNFTGQVIYDFDEAYLRYGTVKKLMEVQEALSELGYGLKIWDAYRPIETQFALWEVCPDPKYVSDPNKGSCSHSRGNTVDVTLVDGDGRDVTMPTGFDDFTELADRDYGDVEDEEAVLNVRLLEDTMISRGFNAYRGEWWHFSDTVEYGPVEE